jgi:N6-L-threonylcarbamoyladenine synthase
LYDFKKRSKKIRTSKKYVRAMAKEIQQAIIDVLIKKTIKAAKNYKAKTILLGGGVAANDELRRQFELKAYSLEPKVDFLVPPKNLCTDNAAMVAVAGYFNRRKATRDYQKIRADANLRLS